MEAREDVNGNLARDYIQGASNFIWVAQIATDSIDHNSADWLFKAENPLTFLLGHASELLLKAALARLGQLDDREDSYDPKSKKLKTSHRLLCLLEKVKMTDLPLDDNFCQWISTIATNFENFDHRYARTFSGFPENEHERLMKILHENPNSPELRKYGAVGKNRANIDMFLTACQSQLQNCVVWLRTF